MHTLILQVALSLNMGAKNNSADCQKDSYLIDYDAVEAAITTKTKAIIPIDLEGFHAITIDFLR